MAMVEKRAETLLVQVPGVGLVSWGVLRWMWAVEHIGVQMRVVDDVLWFEPRLHPAWKANGPSTRGPRW